MSEKLELEITSKNSTGKGWAKVEQDAKTRAKKINDIFQQHMPEMLGGKQKAGSAGSGSQQGGLGGMIGGFRKGQGMGMEGLMEGGGLRGLGALAGTAAIVGAVAMAIGKLTQTAMNFSEAMMRAKENTGVATGAMQDFTYAGKEFDVSAEQIEAALGRVAKAQSDVGTNENLQNALKRLGIDAKEFIGLKPEEALERIGKGLKETGDRAAAFQILGKGGQKMVGFLKEIGEGMDKVGAGAAKASDQNIEAVHKMETAWERFKQRLAAGSVNAIGGVINFFSPGNPIEKAGLAGKDPAEQLKEDEEAAKITANRRAQLDKSDEIKNLKEKHKEQVEAQKVFAKEKADNEEDLARKEQQTIGQRISGRGGMTIQQRADDMVKRSMDHDYDRQQKQADRERERFDKRWEKKVEAVKDARHRGQKMAPWQKRIWDASEKEQNAADLQKNVDAKKQLAEDAQIASEITLGTIEENTRALKGLKDLVESE